LERKAWKKFVSEQLNASKRHQRLYVGGQVELAVITQPGFFTVIQGLGWWSFMFNYYMLNYVIMLIYIMYHYYIYIIHTI